MPQPKKDKKDNPGRHLGHAKQENDALEHTAGGKTTRDPMDAGVPMQPGQPDEPIGPEDAFGPGPKRGDYSDRIDSGPHLETRLIPDADPNDDEQPMSELVEQGARTEDVGDSEGKGGVSTEEALEERPAAPLAASQSPEDSGTDR